MIWDIRKKFKKKKTHFSVLQLIITTEINSKEVPKIQHLNAEQTLYKTINQEENAWIFFVSKGEK